MRATHNGCDIYLDGALIAHRATVAYERDRPGLLVIKARDDGVRVGPFRERLRLDGVERTDSRTQGRERKVTFTNLTTETYDEVTYPMGSVIEAVCVSGCSSCGKRRG